MKRKFTTLILFRDYINSIFLLSLLVMLSFSNIFLIVNENLRNISIVECLIDVNKSCPFDWELSHQQLTVDCKETSLKNKAISLIHHGEYSLAENLLKKISPCFEGNISLKYWHGLSYYRMGKVEEALIIWEDINAVAPLVELAKDVSSKNQEEAKFLFQSAINIDQEQSEKSSFLHREYGNFLLLTNDSTDRNEAIMHLEQAVRINPADVSAYIALSNIYSNQGNFFQAENWLLMAESNVGQNDLVQLALANLYLYWGMYNKSLTHAQKAKTINSDNGWVYLTLGTAFYRMGEYTTAMENLEDALTFQEPNIRFRAYISMGDIYFRLKNCSKALVAYENAKKESINAEEVYFNYIESQLSRLSCNEQ